MRVRTRVILISIVSTLVCPNLHAQLSSETTRRIDELAAKVSGGFFQWNTKLQSRGIHRIEAA